MRLRKWLSQATAKWVSLFCFITTSPKHPSSPWGKEDKADKRQNNRGQGKHPLVPFMKVGAGCLAPGAGNQCLRQTAESFTEEAMQHRATSAVPFVLGGGGRQDIPIPLNGLIRQNEYWEVYQQPRFWLSGFRHSQDNLTLVVSHSTKNT